MAKRLDKTLADYIVGGLMPLLLIGMLCSLDFFILELAYSGQFVGQLRYIFFFFIAAAVLIARISMNGLIADRAVVYGILLAVATTIAIIRFVDVPKSALGGLAWLVPIALMAMIWWSAHVLTRDSTWEEEDRPDSGPGFLGKFFRKTVTAEVSEPAATSAKPGEWFDKEQEERKTEQRKRQPGTMLIYYSLGALPLFGLGQAILPAADTQRRQMAFWLLTCYVACGLAMLLTTSFLALRRYLRHRGLQMPTDMATIWLGMGAAAIATLLVLCTFLPRPNAEYSLSKAVDWLTSKDRDSNKHNMFDGSGGNDTGENKNRAESNKPGSKQSSTSGKEGKGPGQKGNQGSPREGKTGSGGKDQSSGGQGKQNGKGESKQGGGQSKGDSGKSGDNQKNNGQDQGKNGEQGEGKEGKQQSKENAKGKSKQGDPQKSEDQSGNSPVEDRNKESADDDFSEKGRDNQQQQNQFMDHPPDAMDEQPNWLKWLIYGVIALGIAFVLWKYGRAIWAGLKQLWKDILALFTGKDAGRGKGQGGAPEAAVFVPPKPFATFDNPLHHRGNFRSMEEMVIYSYDALESWAYEKDLQRQPGETPLEFARRVGAESKTAQGEIKGLVDIYSYISYADGKAPKDAEKAINNFWETLPRPRAVRNG